MTLIRKLSPANYGQLIVFSFFFLLCLWGTNIAYAESGLNTQQTLQGHVDSITVEGNRVITKGWAGATDSNRRVESLSVWLGDSRIYEGGFTPIERPDVVKATGRKDWLKSGWQLSFELLKDSKAAKHELKFIAKLDNGVTGKLSAGGQGGQRGDKSRSYPFQPVILAVAVIFILMAILLCLAFFHADAITVFLNNKANFYVKPPVIFGFTLFLCFLLLLGFGVTGSSFRIGLQRADFIQSDEIKILGKGRSIRSDEWAVFTPLAIAQYNHNPKFPIVNTNLGEDGQNMLVVGMAGVPVKHVSLIAKPATWGFFLFDLKRALSWYWYFPVFACLFALWGVIAILLQGQWQASFLFALWFNVSPYVAAWSNWPAYVVFFPSLVFISGVAILRSSNKWMQLALGCILGLALTGYVLVLYPPWQVSLGYVFLALFIGIVVRDQLYKEFNKTKLASFAAAVIITGGLLWQWWVDAQFAIQAIMTTVYPGQRATLTGGTMILRTFLRGFINFITFYKFNNAFSNQSEIASFYYLLLPLAFLFGFRVFQKTVGAVEIALFSVMAFILFYMFNGIPLELAKFSLWGRVPPQRADLAVGFSYILLSALLLKSGQPPIASNFPVKLTAFTFALMWAVITTQRISRLYEGLISDFSIPVRMGFLFIVFTAGYWLSLGKSKAFISLNLLLCVATIIWFNPVNIAPNNINAEPILDKINKISSGSIKKPRILVLQTQYPAMYLLAGGLPVANGVFYYPPKSLWDRLDKDHSEVKIHNRYQHLIYSGGIAGNNDHYRIVLPQKEIDVVKVVVDLEYFDFRKTGAGLIVAPAHEEDILRKNLGLNYIIKENGWSWFQIINPAP